MSTNTSSHHGLDQPHQAGDRTTFAGGQVSYLAPMPLPTGQPAQDYAHAVGEINDTYLTFGVGLPQVFGWQYGLGLPFTVGIVITMFFFPVLISVIGVLAGFNVSVVMEKGLRFFEYTSVVGFLMAMFFFLLSMLIWFLNHRKYKYAIAARFNRQRREACFVPEGETDPVFVPWESLSAWVIEAQGVTQYGVQRQYAMGVGFHHADSGEDYSLEFECGGLPLAIANWEAIRAYMDYEVHSLKEIQDPLDLQGPDDPPHEGLHTFYNARARMRRRYREGEVGKWYVAGWYAYHFCTLWTLPFHLTEWEIARVKRIQKHEIPDEMKAWSQPLPAAQWAQPSAELQRQRERLTTLRELYPQHSVFSLFTKARGTDELMVPKRKGKKGKKAKAG
ncbi:hypothetical protein [Oceanimonas smirnovii]|uniref:hypothetical protein n=1 Tax=Oceanimonas smirnovii TaxID=264574 RepID=UPI00039F9ECC|nr:hypothetical protein [Oceanimonas smirnovii]